MHDCSKEPCDLCRRRAKPWPESQCSPGCPGWAVFNGNEIQRCDACARFEDDDEAITHVIGIELREVERTKNSVTWGDPPIANKESNE